MGDGLIEITKDDEPGKPSMVNLTVKSRGSADSETVRMSAETALSLIQYLAEALHPGVGRPFVNTEAVLLEDAG